MGGRAAGPGRAPASESRPETGARQVGDRQEPATALSSVSDWLASQPRSSAVLLTIAAFLILINVFTGLNRIWFHWPVAALLFIVILRTVGRRESGSDRRKERRE
jgi:adenylate cyclase